MPAAYARRQLSSHATPPLIDRRRHRSHSRAVPMSRVADGRQSPRKRPPRLRTAETVTMRRLLPHVVAQEPRNRRESPTSTLSAPLPLPRVADGRQSPRKRPPRLRTAEAVTMHRVLRHVVALEPRNRRESPTSTLSGSSMRARRWCVRTRRRETTRREPLARSTGCGSSGAPLPSWRQQQRIGDAEQALPGPLQRHAGHDRCGVH